MARIAEGKVLHPSRQACLAALQRQMQVIGHQTKGVDPVAEAAHPVGKQLIEEVPVAGCREHILACVAAQGDVVQTAGDVEPWFAGHRLMLKEKSYYAIYQARPHCRKL